MANDREMPTAKVGNYAQQVDTTGMDQSMKDLMGLGKVQAPMNPIQATFRKLFGHDGTTRAKSAQDKSGRVKRTSDLPVNVPGQGIQGQGNKSPKQPGAY